MAQSQSCDINHLVGAKSGREVLQDFGFSLLSCFPCFFCIRVLVFDVFSLFFVYFVFFILSLLFCILSFFLYFVLAFFCILSKLGQSLVTFPWGNSAVLSDFVKMRGGVFILPGWRQKRRTWRCWSGKLSHKLPSATFQLVFFLDLRPFTLCSHSFFVFIFLYLSYLLYLRPSSCD